MTRPGADNVRARTGPVTKYKSGGREQELQNVKAQLVKVKKYLIGACWGLIGRTLIELEYGQFFFPKKTESGDPGVFFFEKNHNAGCAGLPVPRHHQKYISFLLGSAYSSVKITWLLDYILSLSE